MAPSCRIVAWLLLYYYLVSCPPAHRLATKCKLLHSPLAVSYVLQCYKHTCYYVGLQSTENMLFNRERLFVLQVHLLDFMPSGLPTHRVMWVLHILVMSFGWSVLCYSVEYTTPVNETYVLFWKLYDTPNCACVVVIELIVWLLGHRDSPCLISLHSIEIEVYIYLLWLLQHICITYGHDMGQIQAASDWPH